MAQNLKELDRLMTDAEFTELTGINNKTPTEEVETLFDGVDADDVFAFGPIKPCIVSEIFEISPDERKFLKKLAKFRYLLDSVELIGLCESIDTYHLCRAQSDILKSRILKKTSEYKRDADKVGKRHHISSLYYQICDSNAKHAGAIVYRLLQNADLDGIDEIIRRGTVWHPRKGLAVCRAGVVNWCKLPKAQRSAPLALCEIVMNNTRLWKNIMRFI